MGTYEKPTLIQPLGVQARAAATSKIANAAAQAAENISAAYRENFKQNKINEEKDLRETQAWETNLAIIKDTEYTDFTMNTQEFLKEQGDIKYNLRKDTRLKKKDPNYVDAETAMKRNVILDQIPKNVSECNAAVAIEMKKYIAVLGKPNKNGGIDQFRSSSKWLVVMNDFHKNKGANMSYTQHDGRLYLTYTDPADKGKVKGKSYDQSGNEVAAGTTGATKYDGPLEFEADELVRGKLETKSMVNECGDIKKATITQVNQIMGKDDKGKGGYYKSQTAHGVDVRDATGAIIPGKTESIVYYDNNRVFYGGDGDANIGSPDAIQKNSVFGNDWSNVYGDEELMKTLWTEMQLNSQEKDYYKLDMNILLDNGANPPGASNPPNYGNNAVKRSSHKIKIDQLEDWTGSPDQIELAKSMIPNYIYHNRTNFGIEYDATRSLGTKTGQAASYAQYNCPGGTWNPVTQQCE